MAHDASGWRAERSSTSWRLVQFSVIHHEHEPDVAVGLETSQSNDSRMTSLSCIHISHPKPRLTLDREPWVWKKWMVTEKRYFIGKKCFTMFYLPFATNDVSTVDERGIFRFVSLGCRLHCVGAFVTAICRKTSFRFTHSRMITEARYQRY